MKSLNVKSEFMRYIEHIRSKSLINIIVNMSQASRKQIKNETDGITSN